MKVSFSEEEAKRLQALHELDILNTSPEAAYDQLTALAARLFDVPVALVSLLDEQRQWFKSCYGQEHLGVESTTRDEAFCSHTIKSDELLIVPDTLRDERFATYAAVTHAPHLRFYAGAPLHTGEGWRVATLCLLDFKPREFSQRDRALLQDLATIASEKLQQRQREIAARRSEDRLRDLIDSTSDIISILDAQGLILYVNGAVESILGYKPEALVGEQVFDLIHSDDRAPISRDWAGILNAEHEPHFQILRFQHRDGSWVILEVIGRPRRESDDSQSLVVSARNITERSRMETALRESDARKRAIIETALDCIITIDHQGRVLEWNPAAEEVFGYRWDEAVGKLMHDLIVPPHLREHQDKGFETYLKTGGGVLGQRIEMPAMRADGTDILVEAAWIAIPDFDPPLFTGYLRDITQRKINEEALRESEARYTHIAANVPGMVYQFRLCPDGSINFPFVSDGSREICGLAPQQIQNDARLILDMMHPEDRDSFDSSIRESTLTLQPWKWEGRILIEDKIKWLSGSSRPQQEANGDIIWDGILLDVTQRKQFEVDLQKARDEAERALASAEKAQAEAERANRAKSEFLSRMSHELRTPLNAILGFGQLIEMSDLSASDHQSVGHILKGGRHLLELINEVLDIAKIESESLTFSPEPVALCNLCDEVLALIRPLAAQRGITVHNNVSQGSYFVHADQQRLKQILINLLSNAVKYNREGGKVTTSCTLSEGDRVRLSVTDTGHGIGPEQRAKLFVPFERLGAENSGIEGTGIGLALSRHLAEAMGGLLDVQSTPGQGSTFYVELPRAHNLLQNLEDEDVGVIVERDTVAEQRTVLYIEDNLSNLQLMERVIEQRPQINLLSAMQGNVGLELAQTHLPDLILLDLHLAEMEGTDVLCALQADERTRTIPVFIISADATPGQIERLLTAGAQRYITKPLAIREFLEIIDDLFMPSLAA